MSRERELLVACLRAAGRLIRRKIGRVPYTLKGVSDLVTEVDRAAQDAILKRIEKRFPADGYLAEEDARKDGGRRLWVIDPLDGTANFAHGYPICCVSIALLKDRRPVLGGIYDPNRNELFLAEKGKGATLNSRPMRVSKVRKLSEALTVTGFPYDRHLRPAFYTRLIDRFLTRAHDVRRSGSAALDLAWIAAGRADGFWEFKLNAWDVAAGVLLVREAGGKVTDLAGRAWSFPERFGEQTLATNRLIHREMAAVLRQPRGPSQKAARGFTL